MQNYFMGQDGFSWFIGVVEDRDDPKKAGRVRVRCLGHHSEDLIDIPTAELPWASPMMPVTAGGNSGIGVSPTFLIEGTWVVGFFRDPAKQEPVIMGALPGVNTTETTNQTIASSSAAGGKSTKGGFKDPNGVFPTQTYLDLPDTSVLAQGSAPKQTPGAWKHHSYKEEGREGRDEFYPPGPQSIASKDLTQKNIRESWQKASNVSGNMGEKGGSLYQNINTQNKAVYPYNHVLETESGHYVEFDDTPDNERIQIYHRKGSFVEIHPDGNVTVKSLGNIQTIVDGNLEYLVHGDYSLTVDGNIDVWAGKNLTELVDGHRETTIKGTETLEITGAVKYTFENTLDINIKLVTNIKSEAAMTVGGSSISFN